jgi:hypothetical protein
MMPSVQAIPAGMRGFDCNVPVTYAAARAFVDAGYRFAVRYVPRVVSKPHDLTREEVANLHRAGLAVMPVQHVASETAWTPTAALGARYGITAGATAQTLGIGAGTTVWLDLEGVAPSVGAYDIIGYCNAWWGHVHAIGYQPGLYVGWHAGLTPMQLYRALKFSRYWAAYNLNRDQYPAVRGVCMKQGAGKPPSGIGYPIDTNLVHADALGGLPQAWAPDEWDI